MTKTSKAAATRAPKQRARRTNPKPANRRYGKRAPAATGSPANGKSAAVTAPIRQSKKAAIVGLLERPNGAAISDLTAVTGWQVHSVRAALTLREIAYKMQERAHGGLAPAVKRRLSALAEEIEANGARALAPAPLLKPGTRLLREWGGKTHTVIVVDDGFEYQGERYQSLTQIARRITGAHWSGPRFFGLRRAG